MKVNHVCLIVSDMNKALETWCDLLGFEVGVDTFLPDNEDDTRVFNIDQPFWDHIYKTKGAKCRICLLMSKEDSNFIELQQPLNPIVKRTPQEMLEYGYTGVTEVAFNVKDIDSWFEKVKAAEYRLQTDYVWEAPIARTFLFYDHDGNILQFIEMKDGGLK